MSADPVHMGLPARSYVGVGRRHFGGPHRLPTSAAAADRRGRHHTAAGRRYLSPGRAVTDAARLAALLRELPAIDLHCQLRGTPGPDIDHARERARKYLVAFDRDGPDHSPLTQIIILAAAKRLRDAMDALDN